VRGRLLSRVSITKLQVSTPWKSRVSRTIKKKQLHLANYFNRVPLCYYQTLERAWVRVIPLPTIKSRVCARTTRACQAKRNSTSPQLPRSSTSIRISQYLHHNTDPSLPQRPTYLKMAGLKHFSSCPSLPMAQLVVLYRLSARNANFTGTDMALDPAIVRLGSMLHPLRQLIPERPELHIVPERLE